MSCSPAELTSVSIEQFKFRFNQLYLQTVEKSNHLPLDFTLAPNGLGIGEGGVLKALSFNLAQM